MSRNEQASNEKQAPELNTVVTEAIADMMKGMPKPCTHGQFNRNMFLEAVVLKGGKGVAIDQEDIQRYGQLTDKEFVTIKDEFIKKNIIKEETNMFGVVLYSLQLT